MRAAPATRRSPFGVSAKGGVPWGAPLFVLLSFGLEACREEKAPPVAPAPSSAPVASAPSSSGRALAGDAAASLGGARPVSYLKVPTSYDATKPSPLLLVLHGYGSSGAEHASMFGLGVIPERERLIVAAPDGSTNSSKARYWNAVPSCCDFEDTKVDDVAYLRGLVEQLRGRYAIDERRIYAVGHSNGGAMALRLACDAADTFAAVIDLAGPFYERGAESCRPSEPVSVRIMHGTRDNVVPFDGGPIPVKLHARSGLYPTSSARAKAETFARVDGCAKEPKRAADLDFDLSKPGAETQVYEWLGCKSNTRVELWAMQEVGHAPGYPASWQSAWEFLASHPKP